VVVAVWGARVTKAEQLEKKRFAASRHHHLPLFPCPPGLRTCFGSTASGRLSITESVFRLGFASLFWKTATASPFASHKSDGCVRLLFRGGLCSAVCCTPAPSHPLSHAPQHSPAPYAHNAMGQSHTYNQHASTCCTQSPETPAAHKPPCSSSSSLVASPSGACVFARHRIGGLSYTYLCFFVAFWALRLNLCTFAAWSFH